jgi:hypothetical protein
LDNLLVSADEKKKAIKPTVRRFLPVHTGLIAYPVQ